MDLANINLPVLILYYSYVRYYQWGNLGEGYTGPLYTLFATWPVSCL